MATSHLPLSELIRKHIIAAHSGRAAFCGGRDSGGVLRNNNLRAVLGRAPLPCGTQHYCFGATVPYGVDYGKYRGRAVSSLRICYCCSVFEYNAQDHIVPNARSSTEVTGTVNGISFCRLMQFRCSLLIGSKSGPDSIYF